MGEKSKKWYARIIDGVVLELRLAVAGEFPTGSIFVFYADNRDAAMHMAAEMSKDYERKRVARTRRANIEAGNCRCGRPREEEEYARCAACRVRSQASNERYRRRKAGEDVKDGGAALRLKSSAERRRDRMNEMRLQVFLEVSRQWKKSEDVGEFCRWLATEIKDLTT